MPVEQDRQESELGHPDDTARKSHVWDELWKEEGEECGDDEKKNLQDHLDSPNSTATVTKPEGRASSCARSRSVCRKYTDIQYFLVSTPVAMPLTVANRGTRGYWAVKVPDSGIEKDYKIAFLKDTWRDDSKGLEIEGEVMVELVESGVKFVSDVFCQGDLPQIKVDTASGEKGIESGASQYDGRRTPSFSQRHTAILIL